jgi:RecA-family ATPase
MDTQTALAIESHDVDLTKKTSPARIFQPALEPALEPETNKSNAASILTSLELLASEPIQAGETENESKSEFEKIGFTYGELIKLELPPREEIIFGLGRGEVGMFNAVNNAGKTTVLRNLMISLGIGKPFSPFGNFSLPKRVAFLDFEDTLSFLRKDLSVMLRNFSDLEKSRFNDNALLICEYADGQGEDLSLSRLEHLAVLTENLIKFAPDLVIVDTISSAFQIRDENNNAEVRRFIMRPLKQLAKDVNAAVFATHHIGKPKGEEGQTKEASFRGRGASSFADMARLVLNLEKNSIDQTVNLVCAKVKGARFTDLKLKLNQETRWFESQGECREITNYSLLIEMFDDGKEYSTKEIVEELDGVMSVRNTKSYLNKAVENGELKKVRHGIYQKISEWEDAKDFESAEMQSL